MSLGALFAALLAIVAICALGALTERWEERWHFNKGVCRRCGGRLSPLDDNRRRFRCNNPNCRWLFISSHSME